MIATYSSVSLELRSNSASLKSTGFLLFILYLDCSKYTRGWFSPSIFSTELIQIAAMQM